MLLVFFSESYNLIFDLAKKSVIILISWNLNIKAFKNWKIMFSNIALHTLYVYKYGCIHIWQYFNGYTLFPTVGKTVINSSDSQSHRQCKLYYILTLSASGTELFQLSQYFHPSSKSSTLVSPKRFFKKSFLHPMKAVLSPHSHIIRPYQLQISLIISNNHRGTLKVASYCSEP